jgi:hypothetical protein
MERPKIITVWVASPSDVGRERAEVLKIIHEINISVSEIAQVVYQPLRWEEFHPSTGQAKFQDKITHFIKNSDVFILILGNRYGSADSEHGMSNTEKEAHDALSSAKKRKDMDLLFYFKKLGFNADPGTSQQKVVAFKNKIGETGLFRKEFNSINELRRIITRDLYAVLIRRIIGSQKRIAKDQRIPPSDESEGARSQRVPKVFISYSHDNKNHVRWVLRLATNLVENGVDVRLDLWDLHPGDDVADFMERSVFESDRVLIVCTPVYSSKANTGTGGVGYEKTIVTGEIVRNVGTNKFIPILRNSSDENLLPRCLSSRLFIDFRSDDEYEVKLEELLRELHGHPINERPQLGRSPFKP